ncbi:Structural maintenance of chromosomes protein 1 [Binucleata daphniae]
MTIHKLVLHNFKSYKDTHIIGPFDRFSCIVGPNGSGKSNIMDAISFAFSLSTTYLRANNLEELINEGSSFASVEVIFKDNTNKIIENTNDTDNNDTNNNFTDNNFVYTSIKRIIKSTKAEHVIKTENLVKAEHTAKTATSSFFINNTKTLHENYLKFLESKNIYAKVKNFLIFQGEIETIAHKQPIELTRMVEEISGSVKYKQEYEEKEQRLKVLYSECAVLLERKKEMSNRVKNMKENKESYKRYNKNVKKREEIYKKMKKRQIYDLNIKLSEKKKEIKKLENDLEVIKEKINEIEKIVNREEMYEIQKRIYKKESEIAKISEEMKRYEEKKINEEVCKASANDEINRLEQEMKEYEDGILAVKKMYFSKEALFYVDDGILNEYERLNRIYKERIENEINKKKNEININDINEINEINIKNRNDITKNDINEINENTKNDSKNITYYNDNEKLIFENEMLKRKIDQNNKIIEMIYNKRKDGFDSYNKINEEEKKLNAEFNEVMKDLLLHKSTQRENKNRIRMKDSIELLKSKFIGVYGCLIDLVKPLQKKYEIALSVLFKGYENAVIVDSIQTSIECIKYMKIKKIGKLMFIPLNDIKEYKNNSTSIKNHVLAIDTIEYDKRYEKGIKFVLRDSLIIENGSTNNNKMNNNKMKITNSTCVSLNGVLYHKNGSITAGRIESKFVNLNEMIRKKNEILNKLKDLNLQKNCYSHIEIVNEKIMKINKENEESKERITRNEEKISKNTEKMKDEKMKRDGKKSIVRDNGINNKQDNNKSTSNFIENEVFANFVYKNKIKEFRDFIEKREFYVKKKESEYEQIKNRIEKRKKEIQEERNNEVRKIKSIGNVNINESAYNNEGVNINDTNNINDANNINNTSNVNNSCIDYAGLLNEKLDEMNELKKIMEERKRKNKVYEDEINNEFEKIKKINAEIYDIQKIEYKIKEEVNEIVNEIRNDIRNDIDNDIKNDIRNDNIHNNNDNNIHNVDNNNIHNDNVDNNDYQFYENEYNKICLELQSVPLKVVHENNTLNDFEKVNFEYEEKRKAVLLVKEDFENIKKNRVSLFMDCFNKINSSISDIYKLLTNINGFEGNAYVILENNSEPYKDGLKYFVMPPKKRYMEMKMISGGEKTMAALALLFSFHSYKPSSFYIFDELDSALDKINVRKIIKFILKSNLQFIAITLKPEFFENGESLIGVYKKEKVSQVLTMRM